MSELVKNKIEYMLIIVQMFADKYQISNRLAYQYLCNYKGTELLEKQYNTFHTLSYDDVIDDVAAFCHNNGGYLL
ncbi:MAG: DUF3791 domain-containing protein [Bacteroidales bacterium]|nr:DUF3791 domain-containing protein [Bacteroidales bacterium]